MEKNYYTMNPFEKAFYKISRFFKTLPKRVVSGLKGFFLSVFSGIKRIVAGFKSYAAIFVNGDIYTKLSYIIMGFGCAVRGQIIKGVLFLASEVGFLLFFFGFGWNYLREIGTLGTNVETGYFDEELGIMVYGVADNSMLILLYSVMTLALLFAFLALYKSSINASFEAQRRHERGERQPLFREEVKELFDKRYQATLLALPSVMAVAFVILPLIFMLLIAFTNYDRNHQPPGNLFTWVGFENFQDVFGQDSLKSHTLGYLLRWTLIWAVLATFTSYLFGMILALMINKKGIRFKSFWRTIFVITIAVPQFVSLLLMSKMFGDLGPVNVIIKALGGLPVKFLTDGGIARVMCVLINMWVGIPYSMLITTGILMNIPSALYESARIDGAGPVKAFLKITLPYMLFVTAPYLITQFIGNINNFNVIYLLTQGDPKSVWLYQAGETDLLVTWLYKLTVNFSDYNLASVIGIIVFVISAVFSLIVYNSSKSVKNEEEFQ